MATTGKGLPRSLKSVNMLKIGTTSATAMAGNKAPTTTQRGGVLKQSAQADSTATDVAGLLADFNALLAKLRSAGIINT
ncbi:TPA: head fiber protein [Enterobacter hormaechei]